MSSHILAVIGLGGTELLLILCVLLLAGLAGAAVLILLLVIATRQTCVVCRIRSWMSAGSCS